VSASTDSTTTTVAETTTIAPCEPDTRGKQVDIVVPTESIQRIELPEVTVSDVEIGQQDLSFRVDRVGVPVLVKVSYFPNWQVEGADGPYRVAPNFMVVIPTDNEVRLSYGRSGSDTVFYGATVIGLGMLVWFRRRGDVDLDDDGRPEPDDDVGPRPTDDVDDAGAGLDADAERERQTDAWLTDAVSRDDDTVDTPRPDPGLELGADGFPVDDPDDSWWRPPPPEEPAWMDDPVPSSGEGDPPTSIDTPVPDPPGAPIDPPEDRPTPPVA
jgi:hypothetical protein